MTDRIAGAFTSWGKLDKVLLGTMHPISYFDEVPDPAYKDRMVKITQETIEDLDNLSTLMAGHGVEVHRTKSYFNKPGVYSNGHVNMINPRPPYTPRDNVDFVDNKMISLYNSNQPAQYFDDFAHHELFAELARQGAKWNQMPKGPCNMDEQDSKVSYIDDEYPGEFTPYWDSSNVTKIGRYFFHTIKKNSNKLGLAWIKEVLGDKIEFIEYSDKERFVNHVDATIKIIRPGLLLSAYAKEHVVKCIPQMSSWDCIHLPTSNERKIEKYFDFENYHDGRPAENHNNVEKWSSSWLENWADDDVLNTNFDINVISLDENTVIIPEANPEYEKLLAGHNVKTIVCNLRHRFFWGHGLNCVTSDILREDECIDYFK